MRLTDVNGDARLDLVVANSADDTVSIFLNGGSCNFNEQPRIAVDAFPWALALADLNGDKRIDVLVASRDAGTITELHGLGDGTFSKVRTYPAGMTPSSLAVGDLCANSAPGAKAKRHAAKVSDGKCAKFGASCGATFSA